jgi:hypothetical protein
VYPKIGREFAGHGTVNHSARGFWHTNTVESYFVTFKRGVTGSYHHVSPQHLIAILRNSIFGTTIGLRSG